MKTLIVAGAVIAAGLLLGSCETMSKDQCLAGAWGEQGYQDGSNGLPLSRFEDHAKACAKYSVIPEPTAYQSARQDGLIRYCTVPRGFQAGREGSDYYGVCTPEQETSFLPAYHDGQTVHAAEAAVSSARSSVESLGGRLEELDGKITAKQAEMRQDGLTDEQRDAIRNRIQEIRRERADTERDWRRAQSEVSDAERRARDVRWRFRAVYGDW